MGKVVRGRLEEVELSKFKILLSAESRSGNIGGAVNFDAIQNKKSAASLLVLAGATRFVSAFLHICGYVNAMRLRINSIGNNVCQSQASTHGPVGIQLSELPQEFSSQRNRATVQGTSLRHIVAVST
jgi:hypothetical protein